MPKQRWSRLNGMQIRKGKNCMPGSYAVFGLGLKDKTYFPLVEDYMGKVDDEHQSVQNHFTVAFTERHGVHTETIPTLVKCMLHCTDSMKLKIQSDMEHGSNVMLLLDQVRGLPYHQVEHIVYLIWGGTDKLKKIAAKAEGRGRRGSPIWRRPPVGSNRVHLGQP